MSTMTTISLSTGRGSIGVARNAKALPKRCAALLPLVLLATSSAFPQQSKAPVPVPTNEGDSSEYSLVVQASQGSDLQKILLDHRGKQMATISMDGGIRVWDIARKQEVWNFSGHLGMTAAFAPVAFSPDDGTLAVADGSILHFFSLTNGQAKEVTLPLFAATCLAFSGDGTQVGVGSFLGMVYLVSLRDSSVESVYEAEPPPASEIQDQAAHALTEF